MLQLIIFWQLNGRSLSGINSFWVLLILNCSCWPTLMNISCFETKKKTTNYRNCQTSHFFSVFYCHVLPFNLNFQCDCDSLMKCKVSSLLVKWHGMMPSFIRMISSSCSVIRLVCQWCVALLGSWRRETGTQKNRQDPRTLDSRVDFRVTVFSQSSIWPHIIGNINLFENKRITLKSRD